MNRIITVISVLELMVSNPQPAVTFSLTIYCPFMKNVFYNERTPIGYRLCTEKKALATINCP